MAGVERAHRSAVEKAIAEVPAELPDLVAVRGSNIHVSTTDPPPEGNPEEMIIQIKFAQDRSAKGMKEKDRTVHVHRDGKWLGNWQKEWNAKNKEKRDSEKARNEKKG